MMSPTWPDVEPNPYWTAAARGGAEVVISSPQLEAGLLRDDGHQMICAQTHLHRLVDDCVGPGGLLGHGMDGSL